MNKYKIFEDVKKTTREHLCGSSCTILILQLIVLKYDWLG